MSCVASNIDNDRAQQWQSTIWRQRTNLNNDHIYNPIAIVETKGGITDFMSSSQSQCTGHVYSDMHGLISETSMCYW